MLERGRVAGEQDAVARQGHREDRVDRPAAIGLHANQTGPAARGEEKIQGGVGIAQGGVVHREDDRVGPLLGDSPEASGAVPDRSRPRRRSRTWMRPRQDSRRATRAPASDRADRAPVGPDLERVAGDDRVEPAREAGDRFEAGDDRIRGRGPRSTPAAAGAARGGLGVPGAEQAEADGDVRSEAPQEERRAGRVHPREPAREVGGGRVVPEGEGDPAGPEVHGPHQVGFGLIGVHDGHPPRHEPTEGPGEAAAGRLRAVVGPAVDDEGRVEGDAVQSAREPVVRRGRDDPGATAPFGHRGEHLGEGLGSRSRGPSRPLADPVRPAVGADQAAAPAGRLLDRPQVGPRGAFARRAGDGDQCQPVGRVAGEGLADPADRPLGVGDDDLGMSGLGAVLFEHDGRRSFLDGPHQLRSVAPARGDEHLARFEAADVGRAAAGE